MKRLKTFAKYILAIIAFYIFSHVMIFIGLNSTYGKLNIKGNMPEGITIKSAQSTSVNGEIKGNISENISSKYIKFNLYTNIDTLADTYYINTSDLKNGNFEFYFKLNYIESYSIELTDVLSETPSSDNFSAIEYENNVLFAALLILLFL